jgi:DNA-binding NarL/FixJ family response regulator
MTAAAVRVAIAEDDRGYRESLAQLLATAGFDVADTFGSPLPLLERAAGGRWDLVLMDIQMPGLGGIEATRRLKLIAPATRVVMLTVFEDAGTILEAICAGASGYLLKKSRAPELIAQVRSIVGGGVPLTAGVAQTLLDLVRRLPAAAGAAPSRLDLTPREQDVLRELVRGRSYQQVADALDVTVDTVRGYIKSLYRKLQVHSVAEAVSRALRERLV